ncbi:uncharacterized protein [Oscarella lobularis]|uniref:uncharacterized protein isoform X3 n=1 Tax=Oscarella lobularis TaxID=121494 RepID=UPI00331345B8
MMMLHDNVLLVLYSLLCGSLLAVDGQENATEAMTSGPTTVGPTTPEPCKKCKPPPFSLSPPPMPNLPAEFTTAPPSTEPTTLVPTTLEPTTLEPTTLEPTTLEPTSATPTTQEATTPGPTTPEPCNMCRPPPPFSLSPPPMPNLPAEFTTAPPSTEPTTLESTTLEPTTLEPTTLEPTTLEPTTLEPTTLEPTTLEPTTLEPTSAVPTTQEATTLGPTTLEPTPPFPTTPEPCKMCRPPPFSLSPPPMPNINECLSMPCQNGRCEDLVNDFNCECFAGYTGTFCETDINECDSNPCQNGGTCIDDINSFTCDCPPEFSGSRCHIAEARCSSRIENCTDFIECAKGVFPCDSPNYLDTFLSPACPPRGDNNFTAWFTDVLICLANLTSNTIADVYGVDRTVTPFAEECRLVDHRLFNGLGDCVRSDDLCNVIFSTSDALFLRGVLEESSTYRDVNFDIMLDVVRSCPANSPNVAELRSVLEERGFVLCGRIDPAQNLESPSITNLLTSVFEELIGGTGSSLRLSDNALSECENRRRNGGNRFRRSVNETSGVFGLISNGTNATSPVDICQALNNSQSDSNVTVDCPVCGDGILQIESEECDDGGTDNGDGCSAACELEDGFGCQVPVGGRTVCRNRTCGDGIRVPGEDCDSGSSGFGCDSISCTILDGYACPVNDEFNRPSQCFNCGNGVLEFFEECDTLNGTGKDGDGCNDTCGVVDFFTCTGALGDESECEHVAVDFDVADKTTLNRTVLSREPTSTVLLAPRRENLDASAFGNEDWREIVVELINPANALKERVTFTPDEAVLAGKLSVEERNNIIVSTSQFTTPSGGEGIKVIRDATPNNLTHVLLTISYFNSETDPDFDPRTLLVTVIDSNGFSTPVIGVTVQYVGRNDDEPVLTIGTPVTRYEEGRQTSIDVTSNSLTLTDPDHQIHLIQSATARILSRGSGTLAIRDYNEVVKSEVRIAGKEIALTGNASTEIFQALLNNITYTNLEPEFEGLDDVIIELSVFDGKFRTTASVLVRLIDFNVAPVITLNQDELFYTEGHPPSFLPGDIVNITDANDVNMTGATVSLVNGYDGDTLVLNSSFAAAFGINVESDNQILRLSGSAEIKYYQMVLSSFGFINNLSPPVNLTSDTRMAYVVVNDGQNSSAPAILRILVTPVSDGPILRFSPSSQPPQFASLADRSHLIIYTENGPPVNIFPMSTVLIDVDSFFAGNATLSFSTSRAGDVIVVDESVASQHDVVVAGSGTNSVHLSGIASLAVYLQILRSATYDNTVSEPARVASQITVTVWDKEGAASLPVFVNISTVFVNDGPQLDLGVGIGNDDRIRFRENQNVGQHVVSRPHDVTIDDLIEGNSISKMTVELTAKYPHKLDADEYIFLRKSTACPGLMYEPDQSGKLLTFTGIDNGQLYACVVGALFYASSADEPTIFINDVSLVKIGRKIVFTVFDDGQPPANSSATSHVDIVTVNDNSPQFLFQGGMECVSERSSRRRVRDVEKQKEPRAEKRTEFMVRVTSVQVEEAQSDSLRPGTAVIVKFSHNTNTPPVLSRSQLMKLISFSPEHLNDARTIGLWDDNRTLAIVFLTGAFYPGSVAPVRTKDIELTFLAKDHVNPCDSNQSRDDGVFHSSGVPCRVTGTYGVTYEKPTMPRKKAVVVDEETILVDWVVLAMATLVIFTTAVAAAVIGWRRRRVRRLY